jgi:hypothetical protein
MEKKLYDQLILIYFKEPLKYLEITNLTFAINNYLDSSADLKISCQQ